jgi:hypothetical protein
MEKNHLAAYQQAISLKTEMISAYCTVHEIPHLVLPITTLFCFNVDKPFSFLQLVGLSMARPSGNRPSNDPCSQTQMHVKKNP